VCVCVCVCIHTHTYVVYIRSIQNSSTLISVITYGICKTPAWFSFYKDRNMSHCNNLYTAILNKLLRKSETT